MIKGIAITLLFLAAISFFGAQSAFAEKSAATPAPATHEEPLNVLKNELLSYFHPVSGKVVSVEGNSVRIDIGSGKSVKTGMRLNAIKEGGGFIHPVTKEVLGKIEMPAGTIEITATNTDASVAAILSGKPEDLSVAKVKVPATKSRLLFYQGNAEWFVGDTYFQMLKGSGRFDLLETGIETGDDSKIISEAKAKGAEAVLILNSVESKGRAELEQRLLWVKDQKQFSSKKVFVDMSRAREQMSRSVLFGPKEGDVLLSFRLTSGTTRLAVGDVDGDGNAEIILVSGDHIRGYAPAVDLKLLWEFKVPATSEILWIDTADIGKKGTGMLVTSMQQDDVTSYIFEFSQALKEGNGGFNTVWKAKDMFIRKLGDGIAGQEYSKGQGYSGSVFGIERAGNSYKKGPSLKLPQDVNIYDFQYISSPDSKEGLLAWDDNGFIGLYDEKGTKKWISKEDFGGFSMSFKKDAPTIMVDRGSWSVKDRLLAKGSEILVPKHIPLAGMARGLGYKNAMLKGVWWNGSTVEERVFFEDIGGDILDYAIAGDRLVVLARPLFGITFGNILKGRNPLGSMLYIFSLKGR